MDHYFNSVEITLRSLKTGVEGLSQAEAAERLERFGRNELEKAKMKSIPRRFAEQLANPMVIVLLAAAAVSVFISMFEGGGGASIGVGAGAGAGDYMEACIILAVVVLNSVLGVVQESKADKAIEALQKMSAAVAKVRRVGVVSRVPASGLVVGDIVLIEAGDSVPADMRLIHAASLRIEEAALTGESVPVDKVIDALGEDNGDNAFHEIRENSIKHSNSESCENHRGYDSHDISGNAIALGDRVNMAYMGSSVSYGRGEGVVTATGMKTEMGKIADIIQATSSGETPLQTRLSQLSKILSISVLGICAAIFAIRLFSAGALNASTTLDSFMLAISLAVAAIPEGLVAVVTIVLSIGVTNMAKRNAIVRRLTAVETLGCTQVICSDKTGTLTQNKMTVVESCGDLAMLAKAMALCCDSQIAPDGSIVGDPTENALVAYAIKEGYDKNSLESEYPRVAEAPFDSSRKMMSTIHKTPHGIIQYTKGAPDEVLGACTHVLAGGKAVRLRSGQIDEIMERNFEYADRALRVLACAYKELSYVPSDCTPAGLEHDLTFIGLEAMIDPVRLEVKAAVDSCKRSGIGVIMITGDHKDTALAIAKELGIASGADEAITGRELDRMPDGEFETRIGNIHVYARVQPEHKVRIVNMWKKKGFVTAMTGDGVNDAPAMKSGDIGVGMGITGTDVTKNVADMVLADDNFATIVSAVEEGRRIYDNIRKTMHFLLASNLSEVLSIFVATLMGFVLFKPVHLLFINLITDSLPAIALGMEAAQPGIMDRPPRARGEGVFAGGLGADVIYQGTIVAILTFLAYYIVGIWHGHDFAMTSAFLTMSMCEIFHSYNMRSQRQSLFSLKTHNKLLWSAMTLSLALTLTVIYVPFLSAAFSLEALAPIELAVSLGLALMVVPIVEAVKALQRAF